MIDRRQMIAGAAALAAAPVLAQPGPGPFITRNGTSFRKGGEAYRIAGANIWYAAYLGADAPFGNRDRLRRELDRMAALGINNLRLLASSEESPLKAAITPAIRNAGLTYDETLLKGLDFALAEMGKRGMTAVLYLTNFWEWSGGMMTYLSYVNGGRYIDMNDPAHPWPAFADFNAAFYRDEGAIALYHHYVRALVGRTNSITGTAYRDDPTIMSWQLANEPRPGGGEQNIRDSLPAFLSWVQRTAALIKSIDRNHLVSTGSEGGQGCGGIDACVIDEHGFAEIDYLTAHIWPLNWSWVDAKDLPGTYDAGAAKVQDYIDRQLGYAKTLAKPLVIEEFGFPRDTGSYDPSATTTFRDRFYRLIFDNVLKSGASGGPIAGANFWAWNGEGRAAHAGFRFQPGDLSYLGDPPHEPQGWYGVFDSDRSTQDVIRAYASALNKA